MANLDNTRTAVTRPGPGRRRLVRLRSVAPNRWQGESDCRVGPFSSRHMAETFRCAMIDFRQLGAAVPTLSCEDGAWYLRMGPPSDPRS